MSINYSILILPKFNFERYLLFNVAKNSSILIFPSFLDFFFFNLSILTNRDIAAQKMYWSKKVIGSNDKDGRGVRSQGILSFGFSKSSPHFFRVNMVFLVCLWSSVHE